MKNMLMALGVAALLFGQAACAQEKAGPTEPDAIRALLMHKFDRPEARLTVEPVVIRRSHAIAGWVQAERGGRALLRRDHGQWKLVACAGDAFKEAAELEKAGIAPADAGAMAKSVVAAEAKLPAEQRRRLSLFEGVVAMDSDGSHPPHGHAVHGGAGK